MQLKIYYTFFTFFITLFVFAQSGARWIHGNIILDPDGDVAEGVYVTNLNSKKTVISNFSGNFSILAKVDDVIEFKSDYFEYRRIRITQEIYNRPKFVVHLNINVIELQEALISANLTGILTKDVTAGKRNDELTDLYKRLGVNPDINPIKDTSDLKFGLFGGDISLTRLDVGRIYDALSGDLKKRQNTLKYESAANKYSYIRRYFGDDFFVKDLKIPQHKINDFINYTYTTSNMSGDLERNQYLKIMETLTRYAIIYRNLFTSEKLNQNEKITP